MAPPATIAVIGDRDASHRTHRALDATLQLLSPGVDGRWLASDAPDLAAQLDAFDAVWFAPGTPHRDPDAVLAALRRARIGGQPTLATCGGFQMACVEIARTELGLDAAVEELDPQAPDPFVAQLGCSLIGQTRTVTPVAGTRLAALMGPAPFDGFHWCRFGVPEASVAALESVGVVVSARAPDAGVEAIELPGHPFFVATLFQPQIAAERGQVAPLVQALVSQLAPAQRDQ